MKRKDNTDDTLQSHHQAEKTTDNPLIRVMALHAMAYCERLFYLEEVEEIRVADANVYAGRRLHDKLDKGPRYTPWNWPASTLAFAVKSIVSNDSPAS